MQSFDREHGYNICKVANSVSGKFVSLETRHKISESQKGKIIPQEQRDKIRKTLTGTKLSEEVKTKMSISQKGRRHSEETKAKMRNSAKLRPPNYNAKAAAKRKRAVTAIDVLSNTIIGNYDSVTTASLTLNVTTHAIIRSCHGKGISRKDIRFIYS